MEKEKIYTVTKNFRVRNEHGHLSLRGKKLLAICKNKETAIQIARESVNEYNTPGWRERKESLFDWKVFSSTLVSGDGDKRYEFIVEEDALLID